MKNSSNLLRGISENGGILFYGIDSTAVVRRMDAAAQNQRRYHRQPWAACLDRCSP